MLSFSFDIVDCTEQIALLLGDLLVEAIQLGMNFLYLITQ